MAAKLLIYHMDEVRTQALEGLCAALDIEPVRVDASSYGAPVGLLSGTADLKELSAGAGAMAGQMSVQPVSEEMIVMSGFTEKQFNRLLDGLKETNLRIALKAVETPTSRYWTGEMLQSELKKEREAFLRQKK